MPFNIDKCRVMHLGYNNKRMKYKIGEVDPSDTLEEKRSRDSCKCWAEGREAVLKSSW